MAAGARAAAPRAARRPSGPTSSARFIPFSGPLQAYGAVRRGVAAEVEVESRMHANAAQLERNLMALDEECHALIEHLSTGALVQVGCSAQGRHRHRAVGVLGARSAAGTTRPARVRVCVRSLRAADRSPACAAAPAHVDGQTDAVDGESGTRLRCERRAAALPGHRRSRR